MVLLTVSRGLAVVFVKGGTAEDVDARARRSQSADTRRACGAGTATVGRLICYPRACSLDFCVQGAGGYEETSSAKNLSSGQA